MTNEENISVITAYLNKLCSDVYPDKDVLWKDIDRYRVRFPNIKLISLTSSVMPSDTERMIELIGLLNKIKKRVKTVIVVDYVKNYFLQMLIFQ